jgi:hypothetical protein
MRFAEISASYPREAFSAKRTAFEREAISTKLTADR